MIRPSPDASFRPALRRLAALTPLDEAATTALEDALARTSTVRAHREIWAEGMPIPGPLLVASGWAVRVRLLSDGRRQLLSLLLPGDLIGLCGQPAPLAVSTVAALTEVTVCPAPSAAQLPALATAYEMSRAYEEAYLLEQIARLGRLNAQERIISLLLELHERLTLNGLARGNSFTVPLTQELLADAVGLTSVHVNRMLQQARRLGDLHWQGGRVTLGDPAALARSIGRTPARVSR